MLTNGLQSWAAALTRAPLRHRSGELAFAALLCLSGIGASAKNPRLRPFQNMRRALAPPTTLSCLAFPKLAAIVAGMGLAPNNAVGTLTVRPPLRIVPPAPPQALPYSRGSPGSRSEVLIPITLKSNKTQSSKAKSRLVKIFFHDPKDSKSRRPPAPPQPLPCSPGSPGSPGSRSKVLIPITLKSNKIQPNQAKSRRVKLFFPDPK